jgi:AAA ATPase domain
MARRRGTGFVGRQWAVERIADWLGSDSPSLVVAGPPGTGKTALLKAVAAGRHQATPRGRFQAVHVCRAQADATTDPLRVLANIAGQLRRSVPGYEVLPGDPRHRQSRLDPAAAQVAAHRAVLDSANPAMAYDRALRLPFEVLARRGDRAGQPAGGYGHDAVVLIDGLDEAPAGVTTAGLLELFANRLATPVPGLRLLLAVRSGPALERLRPDLMLDLAADRPPGVEDVREYVDVACELPPPQRMAIADAAGDCYLYANVAMRLAAVDAIGGNTAGELPSGLGALYDRALALVGEPDSLARLVFAVLARARDDGLTIDQLALLLGVDEATVTTALDRGRQLLTGGKTLRPHHRCLSEHIWVSAPDPCATDWMIAGRLYQHGVGRWLTRPDMYALRNVLGHLADATHGQVPRARQAMRETITDPEYLTAALLDVGVDDLLSTLSYVERDTRGRFQRATAMIKILRRQARALRSARDNSDPTMVLQHLVYEAATVGAVDVARRLARGFPDAGIFTLWATADTPFRMLPDAIRGHAGQVTSVVVTWDGTRAVSTSRDRANRVWRLASGRLAHTLAAPATVSNMYAEPGTDRVVASTTDGRAQVWDAGAGSPVGELTGARTVSITAFATNTFGTVGIGGDHDGNATVWDLVLGEPVLRLPCKSNLITAVAITPEATVAATGSYAGDVTVWNLDSGEPMVRLPGQMTVTSLALSPTADRLLVGTDCLSVYRLTSVPTESTGSARLLARLWTSHNVTAVAFNPAMPDYALFGGAGGQVAYVRLPVEPLRLDRAWI